MEPRPAILLGKTKKVKTGCGSLYVTVNRNGKGPVEVLARLGHSGGCSACQNEALTRSITLGLKHGVPASEFVRQLRGTQCPSPHLGPKEEKVLSCPDGIAKVIQESVDEHASEA